MGGSPGVCRVLCCARPHPDPGIASHGQELRVHPRGTTAPSLQPEPLRGHFADFVAQNAESMQVTIEGMKSATLRAGLPRALKGNEDVKMAQGGEET